MIYQYVPPRKWYWTRHAVLLTIWPSWLAQRLCPHEKLQAIWDADDWSDLHNCPDCYKTFVRSGVDLTHMAKPFPVWKGEEKSNG